MMTIHDLRLLHEAADSPLKANNAAGHRPIVGADGQYFGHEWARWRRDTLDARLDELIAERSSGAPCDILDVGCAGGHRAADFARRGHRVLGIDVIDRTQDIAAVNRLLAGSGPEAARPVAFRRADIGATRVDDLDMRFDVIHARRVINFLPLDDVGRFFALAAGTLRPFGRCAVSFIATGLTPDGSLEAPSPAGTGAPVQLCPGMLAHRFGEVRHLAERHGLALVEAFTDRLVEAGFIARLGHDVL